MSASPLRRTFAVLGMLALIPILALMATEAITPIDAAIRALSVWLAVVVLGRIARAFLAGALRRVERRAGEAEEASDLERRTSDRGRRTTDAVVEEADVTIS